MNRRALHIVTFSVFFLLLISPWIAGALGASSDTVERRPPEPLPTLDASTVWDSDTFASLNRYVRDRTPLRGLVAAAYNRAWLGTGWSPQGSVVEGPGQTLFLSEDFTSPCERNYEPDDLIDMFARWSEAAEVGDKEWMFVVAPDKAAVLDNDLSARADVAAQCGRTVREEFAAELERTGVALDLVGPLREAEQLEPGRWYYENDSHWTFEAGSLVAGLMVEQLSPGTWNDQYLEPSTETLTIGDDIYGRLGFETSLPTPVSLIESERPDVETTFSQVSVDGTRTVRSYVSSGVGPLIPGTTIIVHDSMMNFAEKQLGPYFERVIFIHWFDLAKADFFSRVLSADRVLLTRVERNVHLTIENTLMSSFDEQFDAALRSSVDEAIADELTIAAEALRAFNVDTDQFARSFQDLLHDPGVSEWAGQYLEGPTYQTGVHPRYGEWRTLQIDEPPPGTPADCRDIQITGPCATWLLLLDVPETTVRLLDGQFDDGDGLQVGRVRVSQPNGILYFYSGDAESVENLGDNDS